MCLEGNLQNKRKQIKVMWKTERWERGGRRKEGVEGGMMEGMIEGKKEGKEEGRNEGREIGLQPV